MLTGLSVLLAPALAAAQDFPTKPIRLIVPFPPGGPNDIIARVIGQRMSELTKQPVVIDNRGGQGGVLGTDAVAKASPDGYTIAISSAGALAISPSMEKVAYDTLKDLAPVTLVATVPEMLVVASNVPAHDMTELIALAKAQPGKLNFASSGPGSLPHLAGELLKLTAKIDHRARALSGCGSRGERSAWASRCRWRSSICRCCCRRSRPARCAAIAIGSPQRAPTATEVPTTAEAGMPDLRVENWYGMVAPAGTPPAIIAALNRIATEAMADPSREGKARQPGRRADRRHPGAFPRFHRQPRSRNGRR